MAPQEFQGIKQTEGEAVQCLFCYMVEGRMPVKKVYEDENCLAILDIRPATKGHTLVIPKKHYELLVLMEEKDAQRLFAKANQIAATLLETLNAQGINMLVADGPAAGQKAPHGIIHLIPRFENDGVTLSWKPGETSEEELSKTQEMLLKKTVFLKKKEEIHVIKEEPKIEKWEDVERFMKKLRRIP